MPPAARKGRGRGAARDVHSSPRPLRARIPSPRWSGSEAPSARTGGAAGQGVRGARAGPRLVSRRFGEGQADTHPPTLLCGGRCWFEGVCRCKRRPGRRGSHLPEVRSRRARRSSPGASTPATRRRVDGAGSAGRRAAASQLGCLVRVSRGGSGWGGPQGNSSLCLARLGGDPVDRTQVGSGPGAPAPHPYGRVSGTQALLRLQALEPGRVRICKARKNGSAQPAAASLVGGFVLWRAIGNRWLLHGMLRPDLPFLSPPLECPAHTHSLLPVLGLARFLLEK